MPNEKFYSRGATSDWVNLSLPTERWALIALIKQAIKGNNNNNN